MFQIFPICILHFLKLFPKTSVLNVNSTIQYKIAKKYRTFWIKLKIWRKFYYFYFNKNYKLQKKSSEQRYCKCWVLHFLIWYTKHVRNHNSFISIAKIIFDTLVFGFFFFERFIVLFLLYIILLLYFNASKIQQVFFRLKTFVTYWQ